MATDATAFVALIFVGLLPEEPDLSDRGGHCHAGARDFIPLVRVGVLCGIGLGYAVDAITTLAHVWRGGHPATVDTDNIITAPLRINSSARSAWRPAR